MHVLNILEHFNHFYREEKLPAFAGSLLTFFLEIVTPRLPGEDLSVIRILELGCGSKSIFEDQELPQQNITAIDFSAVAINKAQKNSEINYQVVDITNKQALEFASYDLIFDSHCLHCIEGIIERQNALENIHQAMTETGIFCAEMMVQKEKHKIVLPHKYIPEALMLEQELLAAGFKIAYFMISRNLAFHNDNGECDLLRVICRK